MVIDYLNQKEDMDDTLDFFESNFDSSDYDYSDPNYSENYLDPDYPDSFFNWLLPVST